MCTTQKNSAEVGVQLVVHHAAHILGNFCFRHTFFLVLWWPAGAHLSVFSCKEPSLDALESLTDGNQNVGIFRGKSAVWTKSSLTQVLNSFLVLHSSLFHCLVKVCFVGWLVYLFCFIMGVDFIYYGCWLWLVWFCFVFLSPRFYFFVLSECISSWHELSWLTLPTFWFLNSSWKTRMCSSNMALTKNFP